MKRNYLSMKRACCFLTLLSVSTALYAQGANTLIPPKSLHPDVKVAHVMTVPPKAVRILYDEFTGRAYFTCYDGEVYQIDNIQAGTPVATKILSAEAHGIPRL